MEGRNRFTHISNHKGLRGLTFPPNSKLAPAPIYLNLAYYTYTFFLVYKPTYYMYYLYIFNRFN